MRQRTLVVLLLLLACAVPVRGDGVGMLSAFELPCSMTINRWVGARSLAMGNTSVAIPSMSSSAVWNPAESIASTRRIPSISIFAQLFEVRYLSLSATWPEAQLGFESSTVVIEAPFVNSRGESTGETITSTEQVQTLMLSVSVNDVVALGIGANVFHTSLGDSLVGRGFGLDGGLALQARGHNLFALNARNAGYTPIYYRDSDLRDVVPSEYSAGFASGNAGILERGIGSYGKSDTGIQQGAAHFGTSVGDYGALLGGLIYTVPHAETNDSGGIDAGLLVLLGRELSLGVQAKKLSFFSAPGDWSIEFGVSRSWFTSDFLNQEMSLLTLEIGLLPKGEVYSRIGFEFDPSLLVNTSSPLLLRAGMSMHSIAEDINPSFGGAFYTDRIRVDFGCALNNLRVERWVLSASYTFYTY